MRKNPLPYTGEQLEFLTKNYPLMKRVDLTRKFNEQFGQNRSVLAIAGVCKRYGIRSGRSGQFTKGQESWNSGTKGLVKPNSGSFKKGRPSLNKKPIGYERVDQRYGYTWVKVAEPNKFRLKHQLEWERHYGAIPPGMVLWFIDGNRQNSSIENLELISRKEQCRRNKLRVNQSPGELRDTLILIAKIQVEVAERCRPPLE